MEQILNSMTKYGVKLFGGDMEMASSQLNNLWKMLDDLAENDPEAYKEFLQKQALDYAEMNKMRGKQILKFHLTHYLTIYQNLIMFKLNLIDFNSSFSIRSNY